jgi:hypothetical protein
MRTGCVVSCPVRMMSLMKESERRRINKRVFGRKRRGAP